MSKGTRKNLNAIPQLKDKFVKGLVKVCTHIKGLHGEAVTDQGHPKEKELRNIP